MTPSLAIQFSAAADGRAVSIDEDCVLSAVMSNNRFGVVSFDKTTTIANSITTPANVSDENVIALTTGFCMLAFPLFAGQSVFVSCNGAGSIVLHFQLNRPV